MTTLEITRCCSNSERLVDPLCLAPNNHRQGELHIPFAKGRSKNTKQGCAKLYRCNTRVQQLFPVEGLEVPVSAKIWLHRTVTENYSSLKSSTVATLNFNVCKHSK